MFLVIGLLQHPSSKAQADTTIAYFDVLFRKQTDLSTASYYGVVRKPSPHRFEVAYYNFDNTPVGLGEYRSRKLKNRHGVFLRYTDSFNIRLTANFRNGLLSGVYQVFHQSGSLSDSGSYLRNRPVGTWKSWYDNGQLKEEKLYLITKGRFGSEISQLQNEYKSWFENGHLKDSGYYKNDQRDGVWIEYLENGQIKSVGNYRRGWKSGTWKFYDNKGKLLYMRRYSNIRYDAHGILIEVKE